MAVSQAAMRRRARIMRAVNVPMRAVLSLPFATPLSANLMLISYTGRKSGKAYRQPVSYVRDGDVLLTPGGGRWTLNLAGGRPAGSGCAAATSLPGRNWSPIPPIKIRSSDIVVDDFSKKRYQTECTLEQKDAISFIDFHSHKILKQESALLLLCPQTYNDYDLKAVFKFERLNGKYVVLTGEKDWTGSSMLWEHLEKKYEIVNKTKAFYMSYNREVDIQCNLYIWKLK